MTGEWPVVEVLDDTQTEALDVWHEQLVLMPYESLLVKGVAVFPWEARLGAQTVDQGLTITVGLLREPHGLVSRGIDP
jgi:hypothetical protein